MTLLSGWAAAVEQFLALWYLMIPLAIGFGIQVGLYTKMKATLRSKSMMTTSGATSGAAMLACCAHHATDVLPFLGLSGISIFLTRYQAPLLLGSIGINSIGICIMHKHLKRITV
ncbi:hypothetical protein A2875_00535 [Candidatus Gottesmanbacteria bacterium RIFCSPHIGHO2_01_FULL_46_14]|nr:MAG: hypothetical protein A2875_00535 [Candidatus Gottesmanbacteria bacterium RIFCSPHIGHO2_01_FULL_46_14]